MEEVNVPNKMLKRFFFVNFGLVIFMGVMMYLAYDTGFVESFALAQMLYPALGAIIALKMEGENKDNLPKYFYLVFIFFTITSILYLLYAIFIKGTDPALVMSIWILVGSMALYVAYNADGKGKTDSYGLNFGKNAKKSIKYILIFVLFHLTRIFVSVIIYGGSVNEFFEPFAKGETWGILLILPLDFLLSMMPFFGEEYGWRYFLQPALQERFGLKLGVIILGLIWGIWHLPLNFMLYSPKTPIYSILIQLIVGVYYSIFFGYVYMKTKNIWTVSFIHFLNNSLMAAIYEASSYNAQLEFKDVVVVFITFTIIYLPFLFTKEYKENENKIAK